ncbi:hypothetical protein JY651_14965 [Pyxidicoccus parkwayensis]|uniref:Uncharacterized protein n=1 Tax=Pyxidicoccus parkwayensis TaxID=2813578 RepID=A0ABX7P6S2_9BACT|nr:hypothetical protein [Pyxidicoccus parkwaysis]QSQ26147.1 hypothetical protein JY651_14965 [Pyxidicoccus parkwaysis]
MPEATKLEKYSYLWDGSSPEWVLVVVGQDKSGQEPRYVIFNLRDRTALLIEDDKLSEEIKRRMIESGVRVVTSLEDGRE